MPHLLPGSNPRSPSRRANSWRTRSAACRPTSIATTAASDLPPNSRHRWCCCSSCAITNAPATPPRYGWCPRRVRQWPEEECTTSSPGASRGTASMTPGLFRISKRCSTTTHSCCGYMRSCGGSRASHWRVALPWRPVSFCCATCTHPQVGLRRRWMQIPVPPQTLRSAPLTM